MVHTYQITGMTCSSCEAKVKSELLKTPYVLSVDISREQGLAIIEMERHIAISDLQNSIAKAGTKYSIQPVQNINTKTDDMSTSWFETYKPVILIFFYITLVTVLIQLKNSSFNSMEWMRHFMAGFFLVFSFFKFLNLKAFAESYKMYDVIAKLLPVWGYLYAFIEFGLGIAFLLNYNPAFTNITTFIIMSISIIGVLQSVFQKKKIQCACLGAVFNLPMSTIAIIEDALMIVMSGYMILKLF